LSYGTGHLVWGIIGANFEISDQLRIFEAFGKMAQHKRVVELLVTPVSFHSSTGVGHCIFCHLEEGVKHLWPSFSKKFIRGKKN